MKENKTENRIEEKENEEKQGGTYADIYAEGGALGPDAVDFRDKIGMVTLEQRPGYAKCEIEIRPWHLNVLGVIHGGVLFSLADTVSGTAAAASGEYRVTTVSGNINYLRAGKNTSKITAEAVEVKNGKTFSVCDAKIFDDKGALLATTTMTFYHLLPRG
ncbi:PaaI family thioesterase [[Clostridium] symbiosum]|uniref:PaaI family thioesterase n=1 Tax=Clostridium symbiosum TaxID=1512 RepID=UPI001D073B1F|nr:PaaI family thioesterase [[Clostridium] symbiosum]MCB6610732.1 PaaI family thioesterase [[Clostridium] symbiosum]MCB6930280.1 PaaI family thioesterase [[Clostridium] symbiosum]